ncbi:MAG TPA: uroporphyrinogen decarboxylase family protein, partial [Anaerovoracaceae bacterium]|nr:uroporphyrinogen decarboxylase family protein [Anaerovoracaceae bacterium]
KGEDVDRLPFHPIIMRWAAKYAGIKYRDFCLDPLSKCKAMILCARDFDIDWVTVMSDPWAEASAFGIQVEYPEDNLPIDTGGHLPDSIAGTRLRHYNPLENMRCLNRLKEIGEFKRQLGNELFIVGWVEGPVAEYVDLRRATNASVDFYMDPESVSKAMDIIVESAMEFITLQVKEGAHCIGIGDAFCSQIGPDLYNRFAYSRQKKLVDHTHNQGALAKLHICGNTEDILPSMISTGADIIDIDHLVPSMSDYAALLGPCQVFSGKADPVTIIQDGTPEIIKQSVIDDLRQAGGRCITSAGCEITPGTTVENMRAFGLASKESF